MTYRTIFVALAALATASAAYAQQTPPAPQSPPAASAEPAPDEPINVSRSREEVVVTGARPVPVRPPERVMTNAQRQRHQAESRCIVAAQDAPDPTEVDLTTPEETCRGR